MYRVVGSLSGATHRHVGRYIALTIGIVCVVVAFAAAMVVMTVASVVVLLAISGESPVPSEAPDPATVAIVLGSAALALLLWRLGLRLIRGDRHLVLFLRKFGFTGASATISSAIGTGLGRRWRLVTLDDDDIAPVGVGARPRWAVRLLRLVLVAIAIFMTVQGVQWLAGDALGDITESIVDSAVADAQAKGESEFAARLGAILVGAVVGAVVLAMGLLLFGLAVAGAATGGLMLTAVGRSARRAERMKAILIARDSQVERTCTRLRRRVRRVLAPRMSVARVADPLWQLVVLRLAKLSDAVIVDISFPTQSLVWEVGSMLQVRAAMVLVGRRDRLGAIAHDPSPAAAELRRLVGDREVVGYDPGHLDAFSDGLRTSLEVIDTRIRGRK